MAQRCFALIPAAGAGARAGAPLPKQYVPLNGEAMLVHTIRAFLRSPEIAAVFVVLAADDAWEQTTVANAFGTTAEGRLRLLPIGGASRAQSVANGLRALASEALANDWVLVHDAARPCVTPLMIGNLIAELASDRVGGLLAMPVSDTLKRADASGRVTTTIARGGLWLAQTPQMFRLGMLRDAYAAAPEVTDEAGAVETAGHAPRICIGSARNLKVTYPEDFALAAEYLRQNQ